MDAYCFDKAQDVDPDWLVPMETALIYLYHHKPSRALLRASHAVELAADWHYVWYVQGLCQSELLLTRQARQSFMRCLELCPRHDETKMQLLELDERATLVVPRHFSPSLPPLWEILMAWTLDRILEGARGRKASDIHLVRGIPPVLRINGEIHVSQGTPLDETGAEGVA